MPTPSIYTILEGAVFTIAIVMALVIFLGKWARRNSTFKLVISRWYASNQPNTDGQYVSIVGRSAGLVMWLISLVRIEAHTSVAVYEDRVEFEETSLSGKNKRIIPISSLSSVYYSYHKPWLGSLIIALIISRIGTVIRYLATQTDLTQVQPASLAMLPIGLAVGAIFYFLNRRLTLAFFDNGGNVCTLQFRRSVIENQSIDPAQADYVCQLVQGLIQNERFRS